MRKFAEREGVDPQRLYRWRTVVGEYSARAFVEVARPMSAGPVEVQLRSGHVERLSEGVSEETLRRVVAILGYTAPVY